jgi:phosphoenolpyruvate carboxykinase (ATP)
MVTLSKIKQIKLEVFMSIDLSKVGVNAKGTVNRNLEAKELCEISVKKGHGKYTKTGALLVTTGKHTGRSPKDRWLVKEAKTEGLVNWNKTHKAVSEETWEKVYAKITEYLSTLDDLYVFDGTLGADPKTQKKVRVVNEMPHINFFLSKLFRKPNADDFAASDYNEDYLILSAANLQLDNWEELGLASEGFIITHISKNITIVGGTMYAGERKKSGFAWMNWILPDMDVCPMHCSANTAKDGSDTAIFFGLSGTGKTTLSADENRLLIGDDEHGWTADGTVFNMEGGCYAKGIDLEKDKEPIIWAAVKEGSLVENVVEKAGANELDLDFTDTSLTQNSRIAYGMESVPNRVESGIGSKVKTVVFLTADASGTVPPISKLSIPQAMYHYISGYTSKLAGTEVGVNEPQVTFSAYFGDPFFARMPMVYADSLAKRLKENPQVSVFLVNTGWNGQSKRMSLKDTRAMVTAALEGKLDSVECSEHPIFKVSVPSTCPGVSSDEILNPISSWDSEDKYWEAANKLAVRFQENIKDFSGLTDEVLAAGPAPKK